MSLNKEYREANAIAYKRYAASKHPNATPSRTHVNSAMAGSYTTSKAPVRAGADDHQLISSKGCV